PGLIGGLRIASEMIRPTVVSFLDVMLRDKEKNLRVEEVTVPASFSGKTVSNLGLKKHRNILLLALKTKDGWIYNPSDDYTIGPATSLIIMTDVASRAALENFFHSDRT
ncbi:MAG: TrkA C-terminal domain-containing protein, partial [Chloroflexi bacterium]|nr:TrkA C-terminal domain-containing protein [Chloroflexota bacterium]